MTRPALFHKIDSTFHLRQSQYRLSTFAQHPEIGADHEVGEQDVETLAHKHEIALKKKPNR